MLKGLKFVWDMGFKEVILESDSKVLVHFLQEGNEVRSSSSLVLLQISNLLLYN